MNEMGAINIPKITIYVTATVIINLINKLIPILTHLLLIVMIPVIMVLDPVKVI